MSQLHENGDVDQGYRGLRSVKGNFAIIFRTHSEKNCRGVARGGAKAPPPSSSLELIAAPRARLPLFDAYTMRSL